MRENVSFKEEISIHNVCVMEKIPYTIIQNYRAFPENYIPVGSVEWVMRIFGRNIIPNYFPDFVSPLLSRKVWKTDKWPLEGNIFIKPAEVYKKFTGFIKKKGYKGKKSGPYICSDVVTFVDEWRYYICNGIILVAEWYDGQNENSIAPILNIQIPPNYCCALDVGMLESGKVEVIECHHPFACGWYGKTGAKEYAKWLAHGWKWIKDNI